MSSSLADGDVTAASDAKVAVTVAGGIGIGIGEGDKSSSGNDHNNDSSINMMELCNCDLMLRIIEYLNVIESSSFMNSSRRYYYLVSQYRTVIRGAELVTCSSYDITKQSSNSNTNNDRQVQHKTPTEIISNVKQKLQSPPNLVLAFQTRRSTLEDALKSSPTASRASAASAVPAASRAAAQYKQPNFPSNTIILGSVSGDIQVNHVLDDIIDTTNSQDVTMTTTDSGGTTDGAKQAQDGSDDDDNDDDSKIYDRIEHKSRASLMCCSFPNATIEPFCIVYDDYDSDDSDDHSVGEGTETNSNRRCTMQQKVEQIKTKLLQNKQQDGGAGDSSSASWKAMIVYAVGNGTSICEYFIKEIQSAFPNIVIVGGICDWGYVTLPKSSRAERSSGQNPPPLESAYTRSDLQNMTVRQLRTMHTQLGGCVNALQTIIEKVELVNNVEQLLNDAVQDSNSGGGGYDNSMELVHLEDAIFGIALDGNVPIRSMVSRGVSSYAHSRNVPTSSRSGRREMARPQSSSPLIVHESILSYPLDDSYPFRTGGQRNSEAPPIHMINSIKDTTTGRIYTAIELMMETQRSSFGQPEFVGIKRPNDIDDGFVLHNMPYRMLSAIPAIVIFEHNRNRIDINNRTTVSSLTGSEIDFFKLSGDACQYDIQDMVYKLHEQTQNEQILGSIMFSCAGRGPNRGSLLSERMFDAKCFAKYFPNVPCLGYYAGGEIGPLAMAGKQSVFSSGGTAALQGFTAVFALFIVPKRNSSNRGVYDLDDCPVNIAQFIESRLTNRTVGDGSGAATTATAAGASPVVLL